MNALTALNEKLTRLVELDDRPRNENGQFDTSADEGMNPHAMHAAYTAPIIAGGAVGAAGIAASNGAGQATAKNAAVWLGKKMMKR